ncbi:MAG TPA: hypothetical protein VEA37_03920 [Flavobacterium sp.]|nr:hypothetical protein [Flavobacterium sp.]
MLKQSLKNFLKKYFYIFRVWDRLSPSTQIHQVQLYHYYRDCKKNNSLPDFNDTGFKVFSQFEEDGKLLYIFALIGMGSKTFVDIGSNDGVNSNCANLLIHFGWKGLFIDADKTVVNRGKHFYNKYPDPWNYKPKFVCSKVTTDNINSLIESAGIIGEMELLSIDLDSFDYWIWKALEIIQPKVVIIEIELSFGLTHTVLPYNANEPYKNGASASATAELARKKGYRLVGANQYGHNMIFVRNDLALQELPEVPVESILTHPYATEKFKS